MTFSVSELNVGLNASNIIVVTSLSLGMQEMEKN